jgi:hypothetical protein
MVLTTKNTKLAVFFNINLIKKNKEVLFVIVLTQVGINKKPTKVISSYLYS